MPKVSLSEALRAEYERRFDACRIRPERLAEVDALVDRIVAARARYAAVERALGIPWYCIGIVHCMECALDFNRHLHNGDPLAARTVRVPAGHPASGSAPFSWEASAIDALRLRGLDRWTDWSAAGLLYQLEGSNGWGYRLYHPPVATPYLWSFSNQYTSGKYVADGSWSATAVSKQCGAAVLLRRMVEHSAIAFGARLQPVGGTPPAASSGPLIRFWADGPEMQGAREMQEFLNRISGIFLVVDGKPGEKTSDALRRVTGHYLIGDPRDTD
jgi:lysozyme family protein